MFDSRQRDDILLLYYSGHGLLDADGWLYFALHGTSIRRPSAASLDAAWVKRIMDRSPSQRQALILDCCHSGAFVGGGLVSKDAGSPILDKKTFETEGHGRYVLAASGATQSAFEQDGKSVFTRELVEGLRTGAVAPEKNAFTVPDLSDYVSRMVAGAGAPMQPRFWTYGQTTAWTFARNPKPRKPLDRAVREALTDDNPRVRRGGIADIENAIASMSDWQKAQASEALRHLIDNPDETQRNVDLARKALEGLARTPPRSEPPAASGAPEPKGENRVASNPFPSDRISNAADFTVFRERLKDGSLGPEMVVLPAGEFLMGSALREDKLREDDRASQGEIVPGKGKRPMRISRRFALGRYLVTFEEFDVFCDATGRERPYDKGWGRGRRPAIYVSWDDAMSYAAWLNERIGVYAYGLPSETQWEYACRAGMDTRRWWGDAWDASRANGAVSFEGGRTSPVDHYPPNPWKLHDMIGNVWEWCADDYALNIRDLTEESISFDGKRNSINRNKRDRVLRGGSSNSSPRSLRAARRGSAGPDVRLDYVGFRLSRTL